MNIHNPVLMKKALLYLEKARKNLELLGADDWAEDIAQTKDSIKQEWEEKLENQKKYRDMNNSKIRKITYSECPLKCVGCEDLCEEMTVAQCRNNLSKEFD